MLRTLSKRQAGITVILIISAVTAFHFLILLGVIPYEITWGGRLKSVGEMYVFESISIIINLLIILTVLLKQRKLGQFMPEKVIDAALWVFIILFFLNTIGNIIAVTYFEKTFAVLTFFLALLLLRLVVADKK